MNLDSCIYEVFETDLIKYQQYEKVLDNIFNTVIFILMNQ